MNNGLNIKLNSLNDIKDFINICERYEADINVHSGSCIVDGKSLIGVVAIEPVKGVYAEIISASREVSDRFYRDISAFTKQRDA